VAAGAVYRIARNAGTDHGFELGVLFALFPLVGLTYVAYPISDIGAIALFLLGVEAMQRERWGWLALWSALALLFHKVMWFFLPPMLLIAVVQHPRARWIVPLAFLPLLLWITGGAIKYHSVLWFIRFNYETHTVKQGLPVLGGLIETMNRASPAKIGKGVVILTTLVVALATAVASARRRIWAGLGISLVVVFLVAVVNAYEIWIAVRYGKLLVAAWCLLATPAGRDRRPPVLGMAMVAALLLASNLAFGFYLAHYFHEVAPPH
jgi:hypothetical protein